MPKKNQKISFEETTHRLPEEGYLRLWQIVGGKGYPAIIPISKSSWWSGIREGIYPAPIRFGKRMSLWKKSEIDRLTKD